MHPSCRQGAETEPPEDHEDYAVDSTVLHVACLVVDLVDSFLLVVGEICRASKHPLLVTVGAVMESGPCCPILAPCFRVVSCQEGGLDAQEHQAHGCTWGATDVSQEDFGSVACRCYYHKVMIHN